MADRYGLLGRFPSGIAIVSAVINATRTVLRHIFGTGKFGEAKYQDDP
jgi:hypothetical protein